VPHRVCYESRVAAEKVTRLDPRPSDAELVIAARSGDARARATLFRRHIKSAAALAYRLLGADDELDDVVQESFTCALAKLDALKDPQAFSSWLATIVTGTAIAAIRRRRFLSTLGLRRREAINPDTLISRDAPSDIVMELKAVYEVIRKLPTDERVILVLKRVEELTLEEIAERTGWSLATVKRRLARAEQTLAAHRADPSARDEENKERP
jgi:RNA polymerase sigma-70 factor, ECF subfamily